MKDAIARINQKFWNMSTDHFKETAQLWSDLGKKIDLLFNKMKKKRENGMIIGKKKH